MRTSLLVIALASVPATAIAQPEPVTTSEPPPAPPPDTDPAPDPAPDPDPDPDPDPAPAPAPAISVGGYLEAYYQLHLQNPSNRLTSLRGFDNRSRTFTLSNVAVSMSGVKGPLGARVVLQFGHTPATYYLAEPTSPGGGGANASSAELWRYLQAASVTAALPGDWTLEAGLFPSPIGPEVIPVKDNFNWSRSNLFFGLPFYHTGVTLARPLGGGWTGKLHVYNGWNSVVDNNGAPSVALSAAYTDARTSAQVLYFGGVERAAGGPAGEPWRHLVDVVVQHALTDDVTLLAQADAGAESTDVGTSWWAAGALYGKVALGSELYVAARGDYFREEVAAEGGSSAGAIFWPTSWMASATATLAYQPAEGVSARLEVRHDQAADDVFFGGDVADDGSGGFVANRAAQDTVTLGVTTWF